MTLKAGSLNWRQAFWHALGAAKYLALAGAAAAALVQIAGFNNLRDVWQYYAPGEISHLFIYDAESAYPIAQALYALACALLVFIFLFSRRHAHSKFALPLKRQTLFSASFAAGALCSIVPALVLLVTSLICHGLSPAADFLRLSYLWQAAGYSLLQALLCYSIAVLGCMHGGNIIKAAVNGFALLAAPGLALWGLSYLLQGYLPGYSSASSVLLGGMSFSLQNPVTFLFVQLDQLNCFGGNKEWYAGTAGSRGWPEALIVLIGLALIAGLFALCRRLFVRYPAQNAGQPEIGRRFMRWIPAGLSLAVTAFAMLSVGNMSSVHAFIDRFRLRNALLLSVGLAAALYLVFLLIFRLWEKKPLRLLPSFLCAVLLPLAVAGTLRFALPGYAAAMPAPEQVSSVLISYRGMHSLQDIAYDYWGGWGELYECSGELLLTEPEDIRLAMDIHSTIAAQQRGLDYLSHNQVAVYYTLRDGSELRRVFWRMNAESYKALLELDRSQAFHDMLGYTLGLEGAPASMQEDADFHSSVVPMRHENVNLHLHSPAGQRISLTFGKAEYDIFLQTLWEEMSLQSLDQRYFPAEQETFTLRFDYNNEYLSSQEEEGVMYYGQRGINIALYPGQFDRTLHILGELPGTHFQALDSPFVKAIALPAQDYLQRNSLYHYTLPAAVFYATSGDSFERDVYLPSQTAKLQLHLTDSESIASLFEESLSQVSFAREGYLVWFIRADGSYTCRFVQDIVR